MRTTDVTGEIVLTDGREMVMPGDHVEMDIELIEPMGVAQGIRFAVSDDGVTLGVGQVTGIR
jgi:elongation factor Tu